MKRLLVVVLMLIGASALAEAVFAAEKADIILVNGKILTVDDRFSIAQAVAIRGDRILAVGSNSDVLEFQGAGTKLFDLKRRTLIPGLIDNHAHWIRAAEHDELRFDGVTSRTQALAMLVERLHSARPGEWIVTLGGWSEEQFLDDPRGFPLEELDRIAPDNPVVIQSVYNHSYLNGAALKAAGITAATPDPRGGKIEKNATGQPSGVVRDAGGVAFVAEKIPLPDKVQWLSNIKALVAQLNAMGITGWLDAGGRGVSERHYEYYRELADRGDLNARVFWTTIRQPATPDQVDKVLAEIAKLKTFQGDDHFDSIGWGEVFYGPVTTNTMRAGSNTRPEDMAQFRRIAQAVAERGLYANVHVEMTDAINAFLAEYEALNKLRPIRGLRWTFSHLDQVNEAQLDRMKKLGMNAGLHSRPLIQGALMHKVHGDAAWEMPPFRRVQDSGIVWGLGSDATAVTTSNPFYTLWFAVTGRMIGGQKVNRQSVTREEALIAHTRSNAKFVFREGSIGSIQPGKYADMVLLDGDYLKVPADQIKDIKPVMTMIGGRMVYGKP